MEETGFLLCSPVLVEDFYPVHCSQSLHGGYLSTTLIRYWPLQSGLLVWVGLFRAHVTWFPRAILSYLVQLLAAGMKEVTRTWKTVVGVKHANSHFKHGWRVMIAIGWARGAGGSIVTKAELWYTEAGGHRLMKGWRCPTLPRQLSSHPGPRSMACAPLHDVSHGPKESRADCREPYCAFWGYSQSDMVWLEAAVLATWKGKPNKHVDHKVLQLLLQIELKRKGAKKTE